jgi:hypothetical protein
MSRTGFDSTVFFVPFAFALGAVLERFFSICPVLLVFIGFVLDWLSVYDFWVCDRVEDHVVRCDRGALMVGAILLTSVVEDYIGNASSSDRSRLGHILVQREGVDDGRIGATCTRARPVSTWKLLSFLEPCRTSYKTAPFEVHFDTAHDQYRLTESYCIVFCVTCTQLSRRESSIIAVPVKVCMVRFANALSRPPQQGRIWAFISNRQRKPMEHSASRLRLWVLPPC